MRAAGFRDGGENRQNQTSWTEPICVELNMVSVAAAVTAVTAVLDGSGIVAVVKDWSLLDWITVVNFVLSLWVCFATYMDLHQMEICCYRWQKQQEVTNDAIQCLRETVLRLEKEIELANANLQSTQEEVAKELGWWEFELEEHKKAFP